MVIDNLSDRRDMACALVMLILFVPAVYAKERRPEPAPEMTSGISFSTYPYSVRWDSPQSYLFIGKHHETILKIDQDGDVFLRGKWIGWDWRMTKEYRDTGKWTPRE